MTRSRLAPATLTLVLAVTAFTAAIPAAAQSCPDPVALTRDVTGPMRTVRYLADDALEGRLAGSEGERCAAEFIVATFQNLGLKPGGASGTYFQDVPLASVLNPHGPRGTGRNIIGVLEGTDPALRDQWIVVGAHYDHLGRGAFGSTAPSAGAEIHNGADDNASGVAAMLEAARRLTQTPPARSIAFLAFTGEESGLLGSAHFAANPTISIARVRAMLNMDMVGRLGNGPLIVYGTGTATEWDRIVRAATAAEQIEFKANPEGYGPSDHTSFYAKDIPVLHLFTNVHADYHKPSDDWNRIDGTGLEKVASIVTRITRELAGSSSMLTLVRGAGRPPDQAQQSRGYGTYLGTIPDFKPVDRGVLISGVGPNSPAEKAGLKGGDIIIRFDDDDVANLEGMTEALRKRKPGDAVRITVLRDGKEHVFNAVLGVRS